MQMRLNSKGPGEIALKASPSFAVGRTYPMKEVLLKEAPVTAKLLLASGLLDGHKVRYLGRGGHVHSSKPGATELLFGYFYMRYMCTLSSLLVVSIELLAG